MPKFRHKNCNTYILFIIFFVKYNMKLPNKNLNTTTKLAHKLLDIINKLANKNLANQA